MNWIYKIRKDILKLSQRELSEVLSVDQSTLSRWENNESSISGAAFQYMQDAVKSKTKIVLPAGWFFNNPDHEIILSYFHSQNISEGGGDVLGKGGENIPTELADLDAGGAA